MDCGQSVWVPFEPETSGLNIGTADINRLLTPYEYIYLTKTNKRVIRLDMNI